MMQQMFLGFGGAGFEASGGTKTTDGSYTVHTFTSSGSFVVESGKSDCQVECLGAGGSGSSGNEEWAKGGGGGGYAYASKANVTAATYPVVIGSGGPRQSGCGNNGNPAGNSTVMGFTGYGGGGGLQSSGQGGSPGGYSIPGGTDLGSHNGAQGNGQGGNGRGGGGNNGKKQASPTFTAWGAGAPGVNNFTPGNNADNYGNGGSGGHSCQYGHNGGGAGSPGIVVIKYLT